MKLFLKEFGIWLGGLLAFGIILANLAPATSYLIIILYFIGVPATTIVAITRLKQIHNEVSFWKSFGAAGIIITLYVFILSIYVFISIGNISYFQPTFLDVLIANFSAILIYLFLVLIVLVSAAQWYIFKKAGKPGYACIVPIWNIIVFLEIAKKPTWWIAMFFIPIANIVFAIMMLNGVAKNFGKSEGFTVGLIFLSPIFQCILGYGDAQYVDGPEINAQSFKNEDLLDS